MYTNLILFLVAIFLFSVDGVPESPMLPLWQAGLCLVGFLIVFSRVSGYLFKKKTNGSAGGYFKAEKQLSIMSLFFFSLSLYFCDPKYYFSMMPLSGALPAFVSFGGLLLFVTFLTVMWSQGRNAYERVFDKEYSPASFLLSNIKANLPIVLPWMVLSLLYDLVALIPLPGLQSAISSGWGDLLFYGLFLVFILAFFPPIVRTLWGCKKLPDGMLKQHLNGFCQKQNFKADFYLWPLFEGRVLTAAVMGIIPGLRYILLTPALIETMTLAELEAILAHEIGHVKKRHLLLFVFLIGGFSLLAGLLAEPLIHLLLSLGFLNELMIQTNMSAEMVVTLVGSVPLLVAMVLYFRYVFGYFIRNFERQADLFSLQSLGSGVALVSAFEKISMLSGNIREQPNWHHFGIGERIDCLEAASRQPGIIQHHNSKVKKSLLTFVAVLVFAVVGVQQLPTELLEQRYEENFTEALLMQRAAQEPEQALWQRLIGDLMLSKKMEENAFVAYEKAFSLDPVNPEIMNNFAWLLLTSENLELRDPLKALTLVRGAVTIQEKGYILDTLATAYWANGLVEEAVQAEERAVEVDPAKRRFYQSQIDRFVAVSYEDSLRKRDDSPEKESIN
ncbi:MAG: Zn-dependent protease with chaperone function [Desulforhopalus sp.]|jgi:Zn-dependent protease with chaperone function